MEHMITLETQAWFQSKLATLTDRASVLLITEQFYTCTSIVPSLTCVILRLIHHILRLHLFLAVMVVCPRILAGRCEAGQTLSHTLDSFAGMSTLLYLCTESKLYRSSLLIVLVKLMRWSIHIQIVFILHLLLLLSCHKMILCGVSIDQTIESKLHINLSILLHKSPNSSILVYYILL